jgi:hypothetical protein
MNDPLTRRAFLRGATTASAAMSVLGPRKAAAATPAAAAKPALLGGTPVHSGGWPTWPEWRESWEPAVVKVLRSGKWYRGDGGHVAEFEAAYAKLLGAKRCLATASGTTSLQVSLHVMDVDAGDEVIVSPYTFVATYNAILSSKALPVFADTDPATLTMDPASIESRITERTRAILPGHLYGIRSTRSRASTSSRSSRMPARPGSPNTRAASAARSRTSPVSASRTPSTCRRARAAPSRATAPSCWTAASPSMTSGAPRAASRARSSTSRAAATTACSSSRP